MYQQGTVRGSAVRAASLLGLAGAGLFGLAGRIAVDTATRQYLDNIVVYSHLMS